MMARLQILKGFAVAPFLFSGCDYVRSISIPPASETTHDAETASEDESR